MSNYDEFDQAIQLAKEDDHDEWQIQRLGKTSPSTWGKLVKKDRSGGFTLSTGKVAKDLIYKIAWERLLKQVLDGDKISNGLSRISFTSKPTEHGHDHELEAIGAYMDYTGNKVDLTAYRYHEVNDYLGGTPDGFVGDDGLIEVKCPWNGGNHLQTLLEGEVYNEEYIYQMQGYMWICDKKWCDFVTYDPAMPDGLNVAVVRVERDDEIIEGIKMVIDQVIEKIKKLEQQLKQQQ